MPQFLSRIPLWLQMPFDCHNASSRWMPIYMYGLPFRRFSREPGNCKKKCEISVAFSIPIASDEGTITASFGLLIIIHLNSAISGVSWLFKISSRKLYPFSLSRIIFIFIPSSFVASLKIATDKPVKIIVKNHISDISEKKYCVFTKCKNATQ